MQAGFPSSMHPSHRCPEPERGKRVAVTCRASSLSYTTLGSSNPLVDSAPGAEDDMVVAVRWGIGISYRCHTLIANLEVLRF